MLGVVLYVLCINYLFVSWENCKGCKCDYFIYCIQVLKWVLQDLIIVWVELYLVLVYVDDLFIFGYCGQLMMVCNFQQCIKMWGFGCGMLCGFSLYWLCYICVMDIMCISLSCDLCGVVKYVFGYIMFNSSGIYIEFGSIEVEQVLNSVDVLSCCLMFVQQCCEFELVCV